MLPRERLLYARFQCGAVELPLAQQQAAFECPQLDLGLPQRHRDPALLSSEEFLALDHHQGALKFAHGRNQARRPYALQFASQRVHPAALRSIIQRHVGCGVRNG